MKILQQAVKAKRNQIIQVHFDRPVVVRLLSRNMFPKYKNGGRYVSQGGHFEESPARFTVPYDGTWHAVIERESHFNPIEVKGRVEVLPPEIKEPAYFSEDDGQDTLMAAQQDGYDNSDQADEEEEENGYAAESDDEGEEEEEYRS